MESKNDRFKRIATRRVREIIDKMRLLSNCSNRGNYEYSQAEIRKIFSTLEQQLKQTKSKFTSGSENEEFKL